MTPLEIDIFIFERSPGQMRSGRWMLIGGALMVCVGLLGFGWALFHRVDQITLHLLSTLPLVTAFGLFSSGWTLCRGPRRVIVDGAGLEIEEIGESMQIPWRDIGWATVTAAGMSQKKNLVICDQTGKKLASLSESLGNFDELVAVVKTKASDQPVEIRSRIQARKARKSALFIAGVASALLGVSGMVAWMTHEEQRIARLLETSASAGEARIDRLFVAPNGVTTRVEYTVKNEEGRSGSRNVEIEPAYHAELQRTNAQTIPVVFVPAEPSISRLRHGEVEDKDLLKTPLGGYGLSGLVALMCVGFLGVAVMQWNGWDVDLDSKTGKISIKRFGEGA